MRPAVVKASPFSSRHAGPSAAVTRDDVRATDATRESYLISSGATGARSESRAACQAPGSRPKRDSAAARCAATPGWALPLAASASPLWARLERRQ